MEHEANVTQRSKCFDNLLHLRGEYDFCTGRRICSFKHWGFCASAHAFDSPWATVWSPVSYIYFLLGQI